MTKHIICILSFFLLLSPMRNVFAYEVETHAYLTSEVIDFYNRHYPNLAVRSDLRNYIIDGARREDDLPRWMNHFYDPVNDRGLTHPILGSWKKSKDWAADEKEQGKSVYRLPGMIASILTTLEKRHLAEFSLDTNFTWQKALRAYVRGEEEKAMFILGHVIHLIEDAGVPDHTRNDPHGAGSPYEKWAARFNSTFSDEHLKERLSEKGPVKMPSLNNYFQELARYSNRNFYSADTIGIQKYDQPQPIGFIQDDGVSYALWSDGESEYRVYLKRSRLGSILLEFPGNITIKDEKVLQDYWSRLSPKIVQYGAGVMNLFFEEAERAKNDPGFVREEPKAFLSQAIDTMGGLMMRAKDRLSQLFNRNAVGVIAENEMPPPEIRLAPSPSKTTDDKKSPEPAAPEPERLKEIASLPERDASSAGSLIEEAILPITALPPVNLPSGESTSLRFGDSQFKGGVITAHTMPAGKISGSTSIPHDAPAPAAPTSSGSAPVSGAELPGIVIAEVLVDPVGLDRGKEFVELYNPGGGAVSVDGWSLRFQQGDSASSTKLLEIGSKDGDGKIIPAQGFFLLGFSDYAAPADVVRSTTLPNSETMRLILINEEGRVVDEVALAMPEEGYSLERKALVSGACIPARNEGEFQGNACDRGGRDDFDLRALPQPQSSINLPEPRQGPAVNAFSGQLDPITMKVDFAWSASGDSVSYRLGRLQSGKLEPLYAGTSTAGSFLAYEANAIQEYRLEAADRDGAVATATTTIRTPSFVKNIYFYRDKEGKTIIDVRYNSRPFIPARWGGTNGWQAMTFHLNGGVKPGHEGLPLLRPDDTDNLLLIGESRSHAAIFGLAPDSCFSSAPDPVMRVCSHLSAEDMRLVLTVKGEKEYTAEDYVTVTYYDYYPNHGMEEVAHDKTRYHFREAIPPGEPPAVPGDLRTGLSLVDGIASLTWATSTDPDGPDGEVRYETNISTSTIFDPDLWRLTAEGIPAGHRGGKEFQISGGGRHYLAVRAVDGEGNRSEAAVKALDIPEGYEPYIVSGPFSSAYQEFSVSVTSTLSFVQVLSTAMDLKQGGDPSCTMDLHEARDGAWATIAASTDRVPLGECAEQPTFAFPENPMLLPDKQYRWGLHTNTNGWATVRMYGRVTDKANGSFSEGTIKNAAFVLLGPEGVLLDTR